MVERDAEATALPRGNDDDGTPSPSPAALEVDVASDDDDERPHGPRRLRRAVMATTSVKAAAALLLVVVVVAGGAAVLLAVHQSRDHHPSSTATALLPRRQLATSSSDTRRDGKPSSSSSAKRSILEDVKATPASFTAGAAELAWEKSENAFHRLRLHDDDGGSDSAPPGEKKESGEARENPLERALEGIFHLRRRGPGIKGVGTNDRDRSRNSNKHRNTKKEANSRGGNNGRRAKAEQAAAPAPSAENQRQEKEGQRSAGRTISLATDSPLAAAPLMAFCAVIFLAASLIMNSDQRRLHRLARGGSGNDGTFMDDQEAEIVEFYEKEMESGMLQTSIPFSEDVERKEHPINRGYALFEPSPVRRLNRSRSLSDSALVKHRRRDARESKCDLYYSRVLHDIETLNYGDDDDEVVDLVGEEAEEEKGQEGSILGNLSSLTGEGGGDVVETSGDAAQEAGVDTLDVRSDAAHAFPQSRPALGEDSDDNEEECFESAQSELAEPESQRSQSPTSSSSSVSSPTEESYDVEVLYSGPGHEGGESGREDGEAPPPMHGSAPIVIAGSEQVVTPPPDSLTDSQVSRTMGGTDGPGQIPATPTRSLSMSASSNHGAVTPPMSNRRSLIKREGKSIQRRVSFSSEVRVREIPRETNARQVELSSESYLYIVLFVVTVVIAVFSFVPVRPILSPIHYVSRNDIVHRAESMLSSHWDVEL